jgi:iron complex outermembrane receptor protein
MLLVGINAVFGCLVAGVLCLAVGTASAAVDVRVFPVDINRQPLDTALRELSRQTGLQIGRFSDSPHGAVQVGPLSGRYTADQALRLLLGNVGWGYQALNDRAFIVLSPDDEKARVAAGHAGRSGCVLGSCGATAIGSTETCSRQISGEGRMTSDNCTTRWSYLAASILSASATLATSQASAQGAPGSAAQATEPSLEEVIVTAERRAQDLQKTAVSVSVRSGKDLQEKGKFTLAQILEDIPGVSGGAYAGASGAGTDTGSTGVVIRGIGANNPLAGSITSAVPATASYVDGVYGGIGGDYDIDRVEVLRGPQGTLYGRSATAGVVASHTTDPTLGQYTGDVAVEGGNHSLRHYTGAINIPVGETFALRASGMRFTRDGYDAPKGGATAETAGRLKLLYQPTANFTALIGAAIQNNDTHTGELSGTLPVNPRQPNTVVYAAGPLGSGTDKFRQYWGQFDWNLGPATLTYMPAYRSWTQSALAYNANLQLQIATPYDHFTTQELRLASNNNARVKWQVGALYYNNGIRNSIINTNLTLNNFSVTGTQKTTIDVGLFGEATFSLSDTLRLTTGIRHDRTDMKINVTRTTSAGATTALPAGQNTPGFDNTTYKVRLEKDLSPNNLVYASVASGFLPGDVTFVTVNTLPPVITTTLRPSLFNSETLRSYELGTKNRFFDRKLLVNADVFYYSYGGFQLGGVNVAPDVYTTLTAPARVKGAELEVMYQPTLADRIGFNYQYVDGKFVNRPASFIANVAQERIPNIAPLAGSLSYMHEFKLPGDHALTFNLDLLYRSGRDLNPITSAVLANGYAPYLQVEHQYTGNIGATWTFGPQRTLTAYVRNAGNKRYKTNANVILPGPPPAPQIVQAFASESDPRTVGVVLNVGF